MTQRDAMSERGRIEMDRTAQGRSLVLSREREGALEEIELRFARRLVELVLPSRGEASRSALPVSFHRAALDTFVWGLDPDCVLRLAFAFDKDGVFTLQASVAAKGRERAAVERAVRELSDGFDAALAAAGLPCCFAIEDQHVAAAAPADFRIEVLPVGVMLGDAQLLGKSPGDRAFPRLVVDGAEALISEPRAAPFASLDALLRSLGVANCAARLALSFRARTFRAEELRLIARLRQTCPHASAYPRTEALPAANAQEVGEPIARLLRAFEREGRAVEISARLEAEAPLPKSITNLAAAALWGTHQSSAHAEFCEQDWRRLLPIGYRLPEWLPSPGGLQGFGIPARPRRRRRAPCEGVLLGHTTDGDEVRLSDAARERHLYCCGATGSGKSTLLANMVLKDIAAGRGLILIDPHGDITSDVLSRVPASAMRRVVALDLADPEFAPGLNVFDVRAADPDLAKPLIAGELLRIFKEELFPGVPEGFGPMFELYYRNAVMLLLEAEGSASATLVHRFRKTVHLRAMRERGDS
jgi:hypothetical protein